MKMRVLWMKENLHNVCNKKIPENPLSRDASNATLTQIKGSTNISHVDQLVELLRPPSPSLSRMHDVQLQCLVCGQDSDLQPLDDSSSGEPCSRLVFECFGIKVENPSLHICSNCAAMIRSSHKLKGLVKKALKKTNTLARSQSQSSLSDASAGGSLHNADTDGGGRFLRRVSLKRKSAKNKEKDSGQKRTIVICTVCKQKYPMLTGEEAVFVCARCKLPAGAGRGRGAARGAGRALPCLTCRASVPAAHMREHLEMHAKTELRGRCRLRSLTKKPSKSLTAEVPKKSRKPARLQPKQDYKKISTFDTDEQEHSVHGGSCDVALTTITTAHARNARGRVRLGAGGREVAKLGANLTAAVCRVCGKDMKDKHLLERHMKSHENMALFECHVCGKIFKMALAFQRHYSIHQHSTNL